MSHSSLSILVVAFMVTACEGAADGLLFGGNEPEETAAAREFCPSPAEDALDRQALFAAWDDTGDGLLSYKEFNDCIDSRARAAGLFATIDDNGDRMIDPAEFSNPTLSAVRGRGIAVR